MESPEKPKIERNVEIDRQSFIEAVSTISIEEIPTAYDEIAVQNLIDSLKSCKVFILGEVHGVKENVDVIYTLFKKFGFRKLALEWEPALKEMVEKFLETGVLDFDAIQHSPDGRVTAGHFTLLKKLKSEGMLEEVLCFDEGSNGNGWNARDAAMARNILANLSGSPTLVVAGNLHTKTKSITFEDEPGEKHPMGENVKKEIPDVATGTIEYATGQFYNFGVRNLSGLPETEVAQEVRFVQDDSGLYKFELPNAHTATVPNPHESI